MKKKILSNVIAQQLLTPTQPKAENVSVKLPFEFIEALDAMALRSGKSRGIVAKTILEAGILQMGFEWGVLPEKLNKQFKEIADMG